MRLLVTCCGVDLANGVYFANTPRPQLHFFSVSSSMDDFNQTFSQSLLYVSKVRRILIVQSLR